MIRSFFTVSSLTVVSRLLGLVREMFMSHLLGAGFLFDAFIVAFKLPNFFRRFLGEGALNSAFVPLFSQKIALSGRGEASSFLRTTFTALLIVLLIFTVFVEVMAPVVVPLIAPGFCSTPTRLELAVLLTRIMFPYIVFVSLSALLTGALNSIDRFWIGAASPILLNIFMISALIWGSFYTPDSSVLILSCSVIFGGIVQLGWLLYACRRAHLSPRLSPSFFTQETRLIFKRMVPGILGAGLTQVNIFIDMILASFLKEGSLSFLHYADRVNQLPLALLGVGVSVVLLPTLSKHWKLNFKKEALNLQSSSFIFTMMLTIPASVGIIMLSTPIVSLLFGHGSFSFEAVLQTSPALSAFALGLPAHVGCKILTTTFFAREDTKTPMMISSVAVLVNIGLSCCLMIFLNHVGIALATSCASWLSMVCMGYTLKRRGAFSLERFQVLSLIKIIACSALMGLFLKGCMIFYNPAFTLLHSLFFVSFSVILSVVIYSALLHFWGLLSIFTRFIHHANPNL